MKRTVRYFTNDYENDTAIEFVEAGLYSCLNCSFTSEDYDYGTDTIHYTYPDCSASIEQVAYEMLQEISEYLERTNDGMKRHVKSVYNEYSNSTLYAIEKALKTITKNYCPKKWYSTIWDASTRIAKALLADRTKTFAFCESDAEEAHGNPKDHNDDGGWHGIQRIDGFFDNEPDEFIVAVGHYGGGNVGFGYRDSSCGNNINEYATAVRNAISNATGWGLDEIIYIEEDEK